MQINREEYIAALRLGKKEYSERQAAGKNAEPLVLDELVPDISLLSVQELGLMEIPAERIIGVRSAGRAGAFSASFLPMMAPDTEFAIKWTNLCAAHMSDTGIEQPIECCEYLGNFYVTEGNKRVSVLRYFGACRIPAVVKRLLPPKSDEPQIRAYYEFLEFFRLSKLYTVQFRRPRDYEKLLTLLGKKPGEAWTETERRAFQSRFHLFQVAVEAVNEKNLDVLPEEVLLLWLDLHSFQGLSEMTASELKKSVAELWNDAVSVSRESIHVEPRMDDTKPSLITRLTTPSHLNVAFVQQSDPSESGWAKGHEKGMADLEQALGTKVKVQAYSNANTEEETLACLQEAVQNGAQVVFTTCPQMKRATLKMAVENPKVLFFNCSVGSAFSSIRTYYGRVFEAKFLTGVIAGAMAENDRIGYIASYPIMGVPASINAFALGARLTNPRAKIILRWACLDGTPQADFFADGIRVVSNRDVPVGSKTYLDFCNYGTYRLDEQGKLEPLASPVWAWGRFYEKVIRSVLSGSLKSEHGTDALNYWLGIDSGVIDLELSEKLPQGVTRLVLLLKKSIADQSLQIFSGRIHDQAGNLRTENEEALTIEQLVHMDWLCSNVEGSIPAFDQLLPRARDIVRELSIHPDQVPLQKECAE